MLMFLWVSSVRAGFRSRLRPLIETALDIADRLPFVLSLLTGIALGTT